MLTQVFCQRKRKGLTGGPGMSARERGGSDYRFGLSPAGPWAKTEPGPNRFPWPFFIFFYSFLLFFCFAICFISFAKMLQNNSTRLLKVYKIQNSLLK
jgi:hypothetical protein